MAQKKPLNLAVSAELLEEFYAACEHYGHAKQKGQVLSAALLMFLRSDPQEQGRCLEQVVSAEINAGVAQMIDRARKEQSLRIATREAAQRAHAEPEAQAGDGEAGEPPQAGEQSANPAPAPRKAARRAGQSKRGLSNPPDPEDLGQ
jgi:antitoxin component of RelBE/YafQ-DinJ toxin-antitoxin module